MVAGTSRAGYLALRLLASDPRVVVAAFAPVTDWRRLNEFAGDTDRVDTDECCRFYLDIWEANTCRGYGDAHLNFQVQDTPGHASSEAWQVAGAAFLMSQLEVPDSKI